MVTSHEILQLPLNGRNFTQLGLLQAGVAPLTSGLAQAGGPMRQGETYAVNGARPEQNTYLVDGSQNLNRMDGGLALKGPVDAIAEFCILTGKAPPEYGGTAGATTSVVTKFGSNEIHGDLYEFFRNDRLDTRNFFSSGSRAAQAEPVRRNSRRAYRARPHLTVDLICSQAGGPCFYSGRDMKTSHAGLGLRHGSGKPFLN